MTALAPAEEIDLESDALLDPDLRFDGPLSRHPLRPREVFLTGATGLLGSYVLREILEKTEATVHCLVRAANPAAGDERVARQLRAYGMWKDSYADRIEAVPGDLSEPGFGISEEQFEGLAELVDVIYHSAGSTNMAVSYPRLRAVNVGGTKEILRMAGLITTKPVHFASSIAIFYTDNHAEGTILRESDRPEYHPSLKGGYSKSKWVADTLVRSAQERGLPACIYRPVRILGDSRTGAGNETSDLLPLLLKGCILLGKYPTLEIKVTMVPADYVSEAMVHLAGLRQSWGGAFHFFNPGPMDWERLIGLLRAAGYPLEPVPYEEWWRSLKDQVRKKSEIPGRREFLSSLIMVMTAPHFLFYKRPAMDSSHTEEIMQGCGISCPPVDERLIRTYLFWWQKSGFLPVPD